MIPYLIPIITLSICCGLTWWLTYNHYEDIIAEIKGNTTGEKRALYQALHKANELKFNQWCKQYDAAHKAEMRAINRVRVDKIMARINGTHTDLRDDDDFIPSKPKVYDDVSELCKSGYFSTGMKYDSQSGDMDDDPYHHGGNPIDPV